MTSIAIFPSVIGVFLKHSYSVDLAQTDRLSLATLLSIKKNSVVLILLLTVFLVNFSWIRLISYDLILSFYFCILALITSDVINVPHTW